MPLPLRRTKMLTNKKRKCVLSHRRRHRRRHRHRLGQSKIERKKKKKMLKIGKTLLLLLSVCLYLVLVCGIWLNVCLCVHTHQLLCANICINVSGFFCLVYSSTGNKRMAGSIFLLLPQCCYCCCFFFVPVRAIAVVCGMYLCNGQCPVSLFVFIHFWLDLFFASLFFVYFLFGHSSGWQ